MRTLSALAILLLVSLPSANAQPLQLLSPLESTAGDRVGHSVSVYGGRAALGAPLTDASAQDAGAVYAYTLLTNQWQPDGRLTASDPSPGSQFGSSVSVHLNVLAVGAPREDRNAQIDLGSVYVFRRDVNIWTQQAKIVAPQPGPGHRFGAAVAISGDHLFVGAPGENAQTGAVHYFRNISGTWTHRETLTPPTPIAAGNFGQSLAFDGARLIVGMRENNPEGSQPGKAYVFQPGGGGWVLKQVLSPQDGHLDDRFGISVALAGAVAVVGASGHNAGAVNNGAAYVFQLNHEEWIQTAKLTPPTTQANQFAGLSVAIAGDIYVGAPFRDLSLPDAGVVTVFRHVGNSYVPVVSLQSPNPEEGDLFGSAIAGSGKSYVVMGAPQDDERGANSGAAYSTRKLLYQATTARRVLWCEPPGC